MNRLLTRNIASVALLALTSTACGETTDTHREYGFYVWCNGFSSDLYYENPLHGKIYKFSLPCMDPEEYDETGGIDLETWTNNPEDIDYIRSMCVEHCKNSSLDTSGDCEQTMGRVWQIENYQGIAVPDPLMQISDPAHLECKLPPANVVAAAPWKTRVIPPGEPDAWPSTGQAITLPCGDYETCAKEFIAPIEVGLYYNDADALWGPDMGAADYLLTSSTGSSAVSITVKNPGAFPSSDSNTVESGRVEYSAPECGETECPFYFANLTLTNSSDTWTLYSNDLLDDVSITNLSVQLRQPMLGVWNTVSGEFYLGKGRVDLWVSGTLSIGSGLAIEETYLITNENSVHGRIGTAGEISISGFSIESSEFVIEAELNYDTLSGSPPVAEHGLSSTEFAPDPPGLPTSGIVDNSWDPDGDIADKTWFVDGEEVARTAMIPTGVHEVGLWVLDERGALDFHESRVMVEAPQPE